MPNSLRGRLLLSYVILILLTLCIVGAGLLVLLQDFQRGIVSQRMTDALGPVVLEARTGLRRGLSLETMANQIQEEVDPSWRVLFMQQDGLVVADSQDEFVGRMLPRIGALQNIGQFRFALGRQLVEGRELAFAAAPVGRPEDERMFLMLATVVRPFVGGLEDLARPLFIAGALALTAAILLAAWMARSIARPLGQLTRATEAISRGNYEEQVPVEGNDEVARLGESFNAMAAAVKRSQQGQKDFVANVSHELKTPLTSIQGFSQAIMEGETRDLEGARNASRLIYEESRRMSRLVADLLTLARLDAGDVPLHLETLDLNTMLPAWVERFRDRADRAHLTLTLTLASPPLIIGDAGRLEQIVSNLIDNALKYTKPGGVITVNVGVDTHSFASPAVKTAQPVRTALLQVRDSGQGIPADKQARLFERFYRVDPARVAGGSGLGLAIAREIVLAHHGEITVESVEGIGTIFRVWLPAQAK